MVWLSKTILPYIGDHMSFLSASFETRHIKPFQKDGHVMIDYTICSYCAVAEEF